LACACFDKVIVSTDDNEIRAVAVNAGAEVPFDRPAELADDYSTVLISIRHAIEWLETDGASLDYVCMVYATAPFLSSEVLQEALKQLTDWKDKSYCLGVTEFRYPIQRAIYMSEGGGIRMFQPEHFGSRSQDLVKAYHDAGQFLWGTANAFVEELPVFDTYTTPFVLPSYQVQDIDTEDDWKRAELLYQMLKTG
jgi:pseudaminic acid cytidylyltransferase